MAKGYVGPEAVLREIVRGGGGRRLDVIAEALRTTAEMVKASLDYLVRTSGVVTKGRGRATTYWMRDWDR